MSTILRECSCGTKATNLEELDLFVQSKTSKYGRTNMCKPCRQTKVREHLINNPKIGHNRRVSKLYGVSGEEYDKLMATSTECEICGAVGSLVYDHCHEIGEGIEAFRGVLCRKCNAGLGLLGDNLNGLLKAVEYLQEKEQ